MATLESLGYSDTRRNQSTPLQQTVHSIQPATTSKKTVASSLLNDINKLSIGAEEVAQSSYQASELANQMVINDKMDKYKEVNKGIDDYFYQKESQGKALTSKDYKEWKEWRDNHYNKTVDGSSLKADDIDNNKEMYKQSFFRPIMEEHKSMSNKLAVSYRKALLGEIIVAHKDFINHTSSSLGQSKVHEMIATEKILGNNDAATSIYTAVANSVNDEWTNKFKNGANSVAFKPYVNDIMSGKMTLDDAFKEIYNDSYKGFSQINSNGEFVKVDKNLTDTAHNAMKKSYASWMSIFKKGKSKAVDPTSIKPANSATYNDSTQTLQMYSSQLEHQTIDFAIACKGNNTKACSQLKNLRDAQTHVKTVQSVKSELNASTNAYLHDNFNNVSFLDEPSETSTTIKSFSGGEDVVKISSITPQMKSDYLHNHLKNSLVNSLSSDKIQLDGVNGLADKIAGLQSKHSGASNTKALNVVKSVAGGGAIQSANSMAEVLNNMQFAYEYKTKAGLTSYKGINKATLDRTISNYNAILKDSTMSEDKKLAVFKQVAYAEIQTKGKPLYMRTEDTMKKFGVTNPDDFISGLYNAGDTIPISGSLDIALHNVTQNGKTYTNKDALLSDVKKQTLVLDSAVIPFFGKSLMAVRPSSTVSDSVLINNFEEQVKKQMVDFPDTFNMNFGELSRNDKIQVRQISDDKNGITTFVDMIDGNGITKTIVIEEQDWLHSMAPKERSAMNTAYNKRYGIHEPLSNPAVGTQLQNRNRHNGNK